MRRLLSLSVASVALLLLACSEKIDIDGWQDWMNDVPDIEQIIDQSSGKRYTAYLGHAMPRSEYSRQKMEEVLYLLSTQQGEVDDTEFVEKLTTKLLRTELLFVASSVNDAKEAWWSIYDKVGFSLGGTVMAKENGTLSATFGPSHDDPDFYSYLAKQGVKGGYADYVWEYDESRHVLRTSEWKSDIIQEAELLYFDGNVAIMLGTILGISNTGMILDSSSNVVETEYELHYLVFDEGRDTFLDGYVMSYKYELLRQTYNIQFEMNSIVEAYGDYDVAALAELLDNGKWLEWGILYYNDVERTTLREAPAWSGEWYAAGGTFNDYTFSDNGTGSMSYETTVPPFEEVVNDFVWSLNAESKTLTMYYENLNGTPEIANIVAYWSTEDALFMAWDYNDEDNTRIVLRCAK